MRLVQASTDGLSSICPPIHLRPHFYIFNGPASESVQDMDGLSLSTSVHLGQIIMVCRPNSSMRWTVRLRPAVNLRSSVENNHGLASVSVHEMDG